MGKYIKRVLVTDDEAISQMILKELLESSGYQVTLASSGEEAIQYFKEEPFPFIIVDFNMPKMNGIVMVTEIRHLEKEAKSYIIGLTACDDQNYLKEGLEAGMNEVYTKPITQEIINRICHRTQLMSANVYRRRCAIP
jgi:CheY-like chemotaxis protein